MKVKLKTMRIFVALIGIMLFFYLIHLNAKIDNYEPKKEEVISTELAQLDEPKKEETVEIVETEEEVVEETTYDGKTVDEIAEQLNKSLNSTISGKGYLIASYSIERGVDPYMATAIILQETGCKWQCSSLVYECNNVGGQVGYGCGRYSYFPSLDEGIIAFIDNLANNYINRGLTTVEEINTKYASSTSWSAYVNSYIESIKAQ